MALIWAFEVEQVTGIVPRAISLGSRPIFTARVAEPPGDILASDPYCPLITLANRTL
jgi:hypothetical protein